MAKTSPKLTRCKIRLGKDLNWWVTETNDKINWDIDGLSVIDPRQAAHLLDTLDSLRDFGLDESIVEKAFIVFSIENKEGEKNIDIIRSDDSVFDADVQKLFLLPDIVDDERSTYAEFLDHITKLQVKMLNDTFQFVKDVAIEDLEEEIRDNYANDYMEGRAIHVFHEVMDIIEYVPDGYSLDDEDDDTSKNSDDDYEIDDLPEEEDIEEDDTMQWEDEEDTDKPESDNYEDDMEFDDLSFMNDDEDK